MLKVLYWNTRAVMEKQQYEYMKKAIIRVETHFDVRQRKKRREGSEWRQESEQATELAKNGAQSEEQEWPTTTAAPPTKTRSHK